MTEPRQGSGTDGPDIYRPTGSGTAMDGIRRKYARFRGGTPQPESAGEPWWERAAPMRHQAGRGRDAEPEDSVLARRQDPGPAGGSRQSDLPVLGRASISGPLPWRLPNEPVHSAVAADEATLGDLVIRAASVVGAAPRCEEPAVPRQDAYGLARTTKGDRLVVAVADGVSNSTHAEIGARVAVSTALRITREALEGGGTKAPDALDLFQRAAGEIAGTARSRGWAPEEVCAVLLVAVVPVGVRGRVREVWTAQVGDVSTWTHEGSAWEQRSGGLKQGLDRNHVGAVLPFHPQAVTVTTVSVRPGQPVAFMTDGLGDALSQVPPVQDYFAQKWADPPSVISFLRDLCFDATGQDDDRTAVVVWPGLSGGSGFSRRLGR